MVAAEVLPNDKKFNNNKKLYLHTHLWVYAADDMRTWKSVPLLNWCNTLFYDLLHMQELKGARGEKPSLFLEI